MDRILQKVLNGSFSCLSALPCMPNKQCMQAGTAMTWPKISDLQVLAPSVGSSHASTVARLSIPQSGLCLLKGALQAADLGLGPLHCSLLILHSSLLARLDLVGLRMRCLRLQRSQASSFMCLRCNVQGCMLHDVAGAGQCAACMDTPAKGVPSLSPA